MPSTLEGRCKELREDRILDLIIRGMQEKAEGEALKKSMGE